MNCKRCGKAIGTDRGICPFCGAMLTKDQMEIYKQDKKEHQFETKMITEKYNGQKVYYEKREEPNEKGIFLFFGGIVILILLFCIIFFLLG